MLSVTPDSWTAAKASSIENGIATPTNRALRSLRANISTAITSTRPERMLFSRSRTMMRMSLLWSPRIVAATPAGQRFRVASTRARTASATSMMLAPCRFCTARATDS